MKCTFQSCETGEALIFRRNNYVNLACFLNICKHVMVFYAFCTVKKLHTANAISQPICMYFTSWLIRTTFCTISVIVKFRGGVRCGPSYEFLQIFHLVKYVWFFTNHMNSYEWGHTNLYELATLSNMYDIAVISGWYSTFKEILILPKKRFYKKIWSWNSLEVTIYTGFFFFFFFFYKVSGKTSMYTQTVFM